MTSIRVQIEAHRDIVASATSRPGVVAVEREDLYELAQITGEHVISFEHTTPSHFFLKAELFEALVSKAHDKLHGAKEGQDRLNQWIDATDPLAQRFLGDFNDALDELDETEENETEVEIDATLSQLRNVSTHYATQIVVQEIQASHGLESTRTDVVELARKISNFIQNG